MKQAQQWQQPQSVPVLTSEEDLAELNWSSNADDYLESINAGELLHATPEFSHALWS